MTNTTKEAEAVIEAVKREGIHVMVGFNERFNPAAKKAEEIIKTEK